MRRRVALVALLGVVAPAQPATAQLRVAASGEFTAVEHRADAGTGVAASSGSGFGAALVLQLGPRIELAGGGFRGTLNADSARADDYDLTRAEAALAILPVPWLAIRVGASRHTEAATFVTRRWTTARVGAEARLDFVGGALTSVLRLELMPVVDVSGLERPNPESGGVKRREQLSLLTARLGLRFGRRPSTLATR